MILEKVTETTWNPAYQLIETVLRGDITEEDIIEWEKTLLEAMNKIPDGTFFRILVNLDGFQAANIQAHKRYREIIPLLLAQYNWKVGYVDLFEESKQMKFSSTRNIACIAAVHVHHDEEKIEKYQQRFNRENERFMTDPIGAKQWITSFQPLT